MSTKMLFWLIIMLFFAIALGIMTAFDIGYNQCKKDFIKTYHNLMYEKLIENYE